MEDKKIKHTVGARTNTLPFFQHQSPSSGAHPAFQRNGAMLQLDFSARRSRQQKTDVSTNEKTAGLTQPIK